MWTMNDTALLLLSLTLREVDRFCHYQLNCNLDNDATLERACQRL